MKHDGESVEAAYAIGCLNPDQRSILASYWRSRGEGEMGAVLAFEYMVDDLIQLGAPSQVVALARRAVDEERRHGLWGREWALFFGHPDHSYPEARRTKRLEFPSVSEHDNRVLRIAFCTMTETVGCHVLSDIRPRIHYAPLRELNRRHLADELQHSRIGWAQLSLLSKRDRALVRDWLPVLQRLVITSCCEGPERDHEELVPFGYLTPRILRAAYERALEEVIAPGLAHLQIAEVA